MTPVTPAQLFGVIAGVVVFGGINLGIWLLRGRGLALAFEDERDDPDEVPVIVADYGRMGKLPEALYEEPEPPQCPFVNGSAQCMLAAGHPAVPIPVWPGLGIDQDGHMWEDPEDDETEPDPKSTFGQERLYDAEGLVQYGLELVDRRCLDARRDFATDLICESCAKVFAAVTP